MKPAQIGLWAVGAAMCAISIGFLFDDMGRGGHQTPMGEAPSRSLLLKNSPLLSPQKIHNLTNWMCSILWHRTPLMP